MWVTRRGPGWARSEELKPTVLAVLALWPAAKAGLGSWYPGVGATWLSPEGTCAVFFGHTWVRGSFFLRAGPADLSLGKSCLSMSGPCGGDRWLARCPSCPLGLGPGSVTQGCGDRVAVARVSRGATRPPLVGL